MNSLSKEMLDRIEALSRENGALALRAQRAEEALDTLKSKRDPLPPAPIHPPMPPPRALVPVFVVANLLRHIAEGLLINVIKDVRELTDMGLRDAKDLVVNSGIGVVCKRQDPE